MQPMYTTIPRVSQPEVSIGWTAWEIGGRKSVEGRVEVVTGPGYMNSFYGGMISWHRGDLNCPS